MRLTVQTDYAVVAMTAVARHGARVDADGRRLNATLLARETGLPLPTVQKLVSRLAAAGFIESARGTGGGFRLARPAATISIVDIVEALEGPIAMTACVEHGRQGCVIEHACRTRPHWQPVNDAVRSALANVTLASLAGEAERAPAAPRAVATQPAYGQA